MDLHEFVDAAHAAFADAEARTTPTIRRYRLGGLPVQVRYAGPALAAALDGALEPVLAPMDDEPPALDIVAWDAHTTGVALPPPPWTSSHWLAPESIQGVDPRTMRIACGFQYGILLAHEPGATRALFHIEHPGSIPHWVKRVPFRQIVGWWAGDHGMDFVHASAVGDAGRCVLLAGQSGSGKSTTALACAERGLGFLGDDLCLVDSTGEAPVAHATYGVAKLEADAAARLPRLAAAAVSVDRGQMVVRPERLLPVATVVAVVLPVVTPGATTSLRPATARDALFAVAPSTLIEPNGGSPASLGRLARLVRTVPCHRLELGTDLDGVADAVRSVLDGAA